MKKAPTIFAASLADAFAQAWMAFPQRDFKPGKMVRFSTNGNPRDAAGWCRVFPDGTGAVFGCHRAGSSFNWQLLNLASGSLSGKELVRSAADVAQRQLIVAERDAQAACAADMAARKLAETVELDLAHPYVAGHGIKPYAAMQSRDGRIVLPVYGPESELQSVQFIEPDGRKKFLYQAPMKGGRLVLGSLVDGERMLLAEGWATACSLHEATNAPVVICFSGGNMAAVAADLRRQFPLSPIVIAADRDAHGKGLEYAESAAAAAAPASVRLPVFSDRRNRGDFNDLHQAEGLVQVRMQVNAVGAETPSPAQAFFSPQLSVCDARDGTADSRPLTESGNAWRMFDQHADSVRYVPEVQRWLCWNGGAWVWDSGATLRMKAVELPKAIYAEGMLHLADGDYFAKWARKSQEQRIINAAVALLSDFPQLRVPFTYVDADPFLIGIDLAKQVIDLRSGQLRPAVQADYVTKALGVERVGNAPEARRWCQFIEQVFSGDAELIDWIQRFCGYLMTGSTCEQFFLFLYGHGANGKSVFVEVLKHVMGDYSRAIASETLAESKRHAGAATPDLIALIGARLVVCAETEDNSALAESLVKSLVSGDTLAARPLYSEPVQFTPAFKLIIAGNHKPVIRGTDHGVWRRVRLVPFNRKFGTDERDPHLLEKLKSEAPHILAWMLAGCIEWQRRGLADTPAAIAEATDAYQVEQDVMGAWLAECATATPDGETAASDLYASFRTWCLENGVRPASKQMFGRCLGERGFERRKSNGGRLWSGITLGNVQSHMPADSA